MPGVEPTGCCRVKRSSFTTASNRSPNTTVRCWHRHKSGNRPLVAIMIFPLLSLNGLKLHGGELI